MPFFMRITNWKFLQELQNKLDLMNQPQIHDEL